jgi:hypothetical protein
MFWALRRLGRRRCPPGFAVRSVLRTSRYAAALRPANAPAALAAEFA